MRSDAAQVCAAGRGRLVGTAAALVWIAILLGCMSLQFGSNHFPADPAVDSDGVLTQEGDMILSGHGEQTVYYPLPYTSPPNLKVNRISDIRTAEVIEQAQRLIGASRSRLRLMGLSEEFLTGMTSWAGPDQRLLGTDPGGEVWLYAPIYEFELPLVRVGQTVLVELPAMPGQRIEGEIRTIDPVLDPATRSAKIRAVLQNPGGALKPEMYVNALIRVDLGEVVAIPEAAVFATGTRSLVFVDKGDGLFEPREVTLGAKADDWYELKAGVQDGERVVTSGNFLIDSESRLKAALQGSTMESHQHGP